MNKTKENKAMQLLEAFCIENDVHLTTTRYMNDGKLHIADIYAPIERNLLYSFLFVGTIDDVGSNFNRGAKYVHNYEFLSGFLKFLLDKNEGEMAEELLLSNAPPSTSWSTRLSPQQYFVHMLKDIEFKDLNIEKIFFRPKILKILEKDLGILYGAVKSYDLKIKLTELIVGLNVFTKHDYQANVYKVLKDNLLGVDFDSFKKFFNTISHDDGLNIVTDIKSYESVIIKVDLFKINSVLAKQGILKKLSQYPSLIEFAYNKIIRSTDNLKLLGVSDIMIKNERSIAIKDRDVIYFGHNLSSSFLEKFTTEYILKTVKGMKDSDFEDSVNRALELELLEQKIQKNKAKPLKV